MVLYKRKRVTFVAQPPVPQDLNIEVFLIKETGEWFYTYELYLERLDYYNSKKFVCEITGNLCLTYFQALESEEKEIKAVERDFPEALREHILRYLQFNRISRLDQLVDKVYLEFKNNYFPGESIFIKPGSIQNTTSGAVNSNQKHKGVVREKVQYNSPDGVQETKYLVDRTNDMRKAILTPNQITRDRNQFTKWLIKTFIKLTMARSNKIGAPWVVKDKYAKKYRISQVYPEDLQQFDPTYVPPRKMTEKQLQNMAKAAAGSPKLSKKEKNLQKLAQKNASIQLLMDSPAPAKKKGLVFPPYYLPERLEDPEVQVEKNPSVALAHLQPTQKTIVDDLELKFDLQRRKPTPVDFVAPESFNFWNSNVDRATNDADDFDGDDLSKPSGPSQSSHSNSIKIQSALECWIFINIYHRALFLDTFTFDDFIHAISWNQEQFNDIGRCELLDEIFCAVLGAIISKDPKLKGFGDEDVFDHRDMPVSGLLVILPPKNSYHDKSESVELDENRGSDTEAEENALQTEKELDSEHSEAEEKPPNGSKKGRSARSVKQVEEVEEEEDADDEEEDAEVDVDEENDKIDVEDSQEHNVYSVINYRNTPWHERLRKRNFKDGNWQVILLGVLSLVEYVPHYKPIIEVIYKTLAPNEDTTTPATVLERFYQDLNPNLRLQALNILINLLSSGSIVRGYIDDCLEISSTLRRDRLDNIRDFKSVVDETHSLINDINAKVSEIKKEETGQEDDNKEKEEEEQLDLNKPIFRRGRNIVKYDLSKREMSEDEEKLAGSNNELADLYQKRKDSIMKLEELKNARKEIEKKLVEIDCQRVKLIGKDRYCNRYWWFENNGLPTLHGGTVEDENDDEEDDDDDSLDNDAVLDETYLMGRLWVQGPSKDDIRIRLQMSTQEATDLKQKFAKEIVQADTTDAEALNVENVSPNVKQEDLKIPDSYYDEVDESENFHKVDFTSVPDAYIKNMKDIFALEIDADKVYKVSKTDAKKSLLIDHYGAIWKDADWQGLKPIERKLLEEMDTPILDGDDWKFYDDAALIESLIQWLNPWGSRESVLKKELINIKEAIQQSIDARRNALWLNEAPEDETELSTKIGNIDARLHRLASGENDRSLTPEEDNSETELRTRSKRSSTLVANSRLPPRKRQKLSEEEILITGNERELQDLKEKLLESLNEKRHDRELSRILEWVNMTARDKFDKSLYEGGDKMKKARRGRL